jgi:hypothetical protein
MALPPLFAILGPLSDPDFDVVEDWHPTPEIIEVMDGPKYLLMCTASDGKLQTVDFIEDTKGELTIAKKLLKYEQIPVQVVLKPKPYSPAVQMKFQKTNVFLSRPSSTKGYAAIPIYKLITQRTTWYFPIEDKYKRKLSMFEVGEIRKEVA